MKLTEEIFREFCFHDKNPGNYLNQDHAAYVSEGWMDTADICNHLYLIYTLTRFYPHPPKVLEIGVSDGTSTLAFLKALSEIKEHKLISVDYDECQKLAIKSTHFFELSQWWDFRLQKSQEFFIRNSDSFDIIFIDGDHRYNGARQDFNNAIGCWNQGGLIFIHDAFMHDCAHEDGCARLVYEIMEDPHYNCFIFPAPQAMAIVQRKSDMHVHFAKWVAQIGTKINQGG